jgi:hypothetical protein
MYVQRNNEARSRIIVAMQKTILPVCVCVRACAQARGRLHARAYM